MRLSVVVPAHNEEGNLVPLTDSILDMLRRHKLEGELVIVDDNSSDGTTKLTDSLAKKHRNVVALHRKANPGMGNALKDGTRKARGRYVAWVMGDRCDNLETIPKMVKKLDQGYDMVFGSRYIPGGTSGDLDKFKAFSSSGYTRLARLVFGIKVHDITNAFRAFRKELIDKIEIEAGDFAISPEFSIKAQLKGYKLGEVPTNYRNRVFGKTKFRMFQMGLRYLSLMKCRFRKY
jgi:glycosyltransferase involved in cell wall biosynthesis